MIAAARNREDPNEVTSIACWITGDAAASLDRLPPEAAGRAVIAEIERIRPAAPAQLEFSRSIHGAQILMPAVHGLISARAMSHVMQPKLGAAHGRLHFCGEHLATESRGMEGAMESGERAASEILGA